MGIASCLWMGSAVGRQDCPPHSQAPALVGRLLADYRRIAPSRLVNSSPSSRIATIHGFLCNRLGSPGDHQRWMVPACGRPYLPASPDLAAGAIPPEENEARSTGTPEKTRR